MDGQFEPEKSESDCWMSNGDKYRLLGLTILSAALLAGVVLIAAYHQSAAWWPDEHVYLKTAARLAIDGRVTFDSEKEEVLPVIAFYQKNARGVYAPAYPPGFPLLLAFAHVLFGPSACLWVNTALGILGVWLTYLVGRKLLGRNEGIIAASLLAVNPVYLRYANSFMSDLSALVIVTASLAMLLKGRETASTRLRVLAMAASGVLAGYAISVRWAAAVGLVPALALLLLWTSTGGRPSWREAAKDILSFAAGLALPLVALGYYQLSLFGQVMSPYISGAMSSFGFEYARSNLTHMLQSVPSLTLGTLFMPAMAGFGLLFLKRPKICAILALWTFAFFIFHLFYARLYLRFLMASFPGLVCAAAYFIVEISRLLSTRNRNWIPRIAFAITIVTCVVTFIFAHNLLAKWYKVFPQAQELCALAADHVPEGSAILGRRIKMNAISFFHHNRYELISINQFESPHPKPLQVGSGRAWRRNMTNIKGGWSKIAEANGKRIRKTLASNKKVFLLVDRETTDLCRNGFNNYFSTSEVAAAKGHYALIEIYPKQQSPEI